MKLRIRFLLPVWLAATISLSLAGEKGPWSWRGQTVTEFDSQTADLDWRIVNDGVMGGLSKGNVEISDSGVMTFSGDLSLQNNGGFSLVRSRKVDLNLSNDLGMLLKVKGDGRTYELRLESDARHRGRVVSFSGKFATKAGQWMQVKVPFSEFRGGWRGMDLPDAVLNPAAIEQVGIILADKKEGPFELEVDYIRTFGKGQGDYTEKAPNPGPSTQSGTSGSLIETLVADGRFTVLKKALDTAGLTVFFQWDNPLTVFAPTDEAFAKIPEETLNDLLLPGNKDQLVALLSHHVSAGNNTLSDGLAAGEIKTVQGSPVAFQFRNGKAQVNNARVLEADQKCSDGIIHVIDNVLMPPSGGGKKSDS
ncbi:MAG: CIA30 family protein [Verrucomicrobiales bacterium]|nr:CIA30 family protein [Verrucomicrobiales bacterium]